MSDDNISAISTMSISKYLQYLQYSIYDRWVAYNVVDFVNQITMLVGTLADCCTDSTCPVMSAGAKYEVGGESVEIFFNCI